MADETPEQKAARKRRGWIIAVIGAVVLLAILVLVVYLHAQHPTTLVEQSTAHARQGSHGGHQHPKSIHHLRNWTPATFVAVLGALASLVGIVTGLVKALKK